MDPQVKPIKLLNMRMATVLYDHVIDKSLQMGNRNPISLDCELALERMQMREFYDR